MKCTKPAYRYIHRHIHMYVYMSIANKKCNYSVTALSIQY